jgi:hypothetical protein
VGVPLATASAGSEAAVAYVEGTTASENQRWRILLQRVDEAGARRGGPVELTAAPGAMPYGRLTLATDGHRYLACWEFGEPIACAVALVGGGVTASPLRVPGASPALAVSAGAWALAYGGLSGAIVVQRLTDEARALGSAEVVVAGDGTSLPSPSSALTPLLAAMGSGFVLVGGQTMRVHGLDAGLRPVGTPVDLGVPFWFSGAVAVAGTTLVVSLAVPYGSHVFVIDAGTLASTVDIGGGGKPGLDVALAADGTSIAAAWRDDHGGVQHGAIGAGGRPPLALPPGNSITGAPGAIVLVRAGTRLLAVTTDHDPIGTELLVAGVPR